MKKKEKIMRFIWRLELLRVLRTRIVQLLMKPVKAKKEEN